MLSLKNQKYENIRKFLYFFLNNGKLFIIKWQKEDTTLSDAEK